MRREWSGVHKASIAVAVARGDFWEAAEFLGPIARARRLHWLGWRPSSAASASGSTSVTRRALRYGVYRPLVQAGHACSIVAPSLIRKHPPSTAVLIAADWLGAQAA